MDPAATPAIVADDAVTASDLVRHFGHWQRRALQAPIYILNHGRPQFVLASIEFMQALSSARAPQVDGDIAQILDALLDPVLICDARAVVVMAGRAARLYFGKGLRTGAALAAFLPPRCAAALTDIVYRVARAGIAERAELPDMAGRGRLELTVEPTADGVVIIGHPFGSSDARAEALNSALAALPGHALAIIEPRGLLAEADPSLARLTGHSPPIGQPAAELFAPASRATVAAALDQVFAGGIAHTFTADLTTADDQSMPVSIGLAPIRRGLIIAAVQAVIAPRV